MSAHKITATAPRLRFSEFSGNWEEKRLRDVFSITRGQVLAMSEVKPVHTDQHPYPVYSSQTLDGGLAGYFKSYLYSDAITWTTDGANAGETRFRRGPFYCTNVCGVLLNDQGWANKCVAEIINGITKRYVSYVGNPKLMNDVMSKIVVALPHPDEQAKIAAFLGAVDARLEGLKARHTHLTQYKRGVMQRLFSQTLRFTQPDGTPFPDWEEKRLGDVFSERNEKGFSNLQLLAVTISTGVVKTSSLSRESNTPSNKKSYKRLCIGDIAYNTMRMWQGASGVSAYEGIISPAYTVIVPNDRNVSEFWGQYFKCRPVIKIFERHSQGLVSDTWSIKYPALSSIKLFAPHLDEQTKIADFLSTIDRRIDLLNQQFTTTEGFKKFLLQQMFV